MELNNNVRKALWVDMKMLVLGLMTRINLDKEVESSKAIKLISTTRIWLHQLKPWNLTGQKKALTHWRSCFFPTYKWLPLVGLVLCVHSYKYLECIPTLSRLRGNIIYWLICKMRKEKFKLRTYYYNAAPPPILKETLETITE